MILAGDEFLRTQQGNNNAWCQDNDIELGGLDAGRDERRLPAVRPRDDPAAEAAPGAAAAAVLPGRARPAGGRPSRRQAPGTRAAQRPAAEDPAPARRPWPGWPTSTGTGRSRSPRTSRPSRGRSPSPSTAGSPAATTCDYRPDADIYVAINGGDVATAFLIPPAPSGRPWRRVSGHRARRARTTSWPTRRSGSSSPRGAATRSTPSPLVVLVTEG